MSVIYLVRHGQTAANEKRLYCGATDEPLSARGRSALVMLSGYPAPEGLTFMTSGMRRTKQTLTTLYGEIPNRDVPALAEMNFGVFEMRSYEQMKTDVDYISWITDETGDYICPGGESANAFKARVFAAFDELTKTEKDLLIVTHGGVIANIMARAFPAEGKNFYEWQSTYGCGYAVYCANGAPHSYGAIPIAQCEMDS